MAEAARRLPAARAQRVAQVTARAPHRLVRLDGEDDVAGFRAAVRNLVNEGVEPDAVDWQVAQAVEGDLFAGLADIDDVGAGHRIHRDDVHADTTTAVDETGDLFVDQPAHAPATAAASAGAATASPLTLPSSIVTIFQHAALHADPSRFALLYRLIWRLAHEPRLRDDPLDADRMAAERMARAVRRDMHKMTAFVRFRPVPQAMDDGGFNVCHVAWFEPEHHIVEANAPFFARRFAQMCWAILTPERSVRWNGRTLAFGPGARREDAPGADAGEQMWLTYYQSIFNPARLKLAMMQKEMPRRYWKNLPEAVLIQPLAALAAERSGRMIEQDASEPKRRRPGVSLALRLDQRAPANDALHGAAHNEPESESSATRSDESAGTAHTTQGRSETVFPPIVPVDLFRASDPTALAAATERCRACPIGQHATQAVSGEGPVGARLMLVGEQPGDQEDLRGRPFVGPAGQLLDRAFKQLGWPRNTLYLTNAVKHFKYELRGQRRIHKTASQREAAACAHWLEGEIALTRPQAVIALGATAARSLMGRHVAVTSERGQWLVREDGLRVLVTLHPAALLRMDPAVFDVGYDDWLRDLAHASEHAPETLPTDV